MFFRLLLASSISLAITPSAFPQQVELKAFGTTPVDQAPFALRMTRSDVGKDQVQPDDVSGLADDFAAMKSQSSPEQSTFQIGTKSRIGNTTKTIIIHVADPIKPLLDAGTARAVCAFPRYAPSPHLSQEAEQRRAIWYPAMVQAACDAGLPVHLFDALIIQESRYNPVAVSRKGATGLAQIMPSSARILGVRNIWDPRENMRAGARYLRALLDEFGRYDLALAAYNAGAGRVRANGRIPRITETMTYVSAILMTMQRQLAQSMTRRE